MRVLVINGPNLNLLGQRETNLYGDVSLEDINYAMQKLAAEKQVEIDFFQSNHEGELVDRIQQAQGRVDAMIINAGALTHYSIALLDALKAVNIPFIEVHLTNIYAREEFRHQSLLSPIARGGIFGLGAAGYSLALRAVCEWFK
ncbi:MAG: type II 3-dehydroquinate dehydratase [Syntrophomonadaceae bacterium]|nr:type II 3-dehydroquinate dehydratase [Syntrophomonadaceae bacterium]